MDAPYYNGPPGSRWNDTDARPATERRSTARECLVWAMDVCRRVPEGSSPFCRGCLEAQRVKRESAA